MKSPEKIDELLSGLLDNQLTVRQQTEVHRLLANDERIGRRLRELRKIKALVGSLPPAEAPEYLLDEIKAELARRTLLGRRSAMLSEKAGLRELMFRKFVAAAAMIALAAVLAVVVYTIVAPVEVPSPAPSVPAAPTAAAMRFNGRLELAASAFKEVDASIDRAIAANPLVELKGLERTGRRSTYVLTCTRLGLESLMAHLQNNWPRFDSSRLVLETDTFGKSVAVDGATPEQVIEITGQRDLEESVRVAKDLAVINAAAQRLAQMSVLVAEAGNGAVIDTTMPALTKHQKPAPKSLGEATINLTISVEQAE